MMYITNDANSKQISVSNGVDIYLDTLERLIKSFYCDPSTLQYSLKNGSCK